ncbi:MAG: hypothetical protein AAF383_04255 [Cyanobacteria bacterium P01_A01_bin.83]
MSQESDNGKNGFLYPKANYRGKLSPDNPQNLVFNANLQEFAQKVAFICGLETNGKISAQEAYDRIKDLWHQLESSKQELLDIPEED